MIEKEEIKPILSKEGILKNSHQGMRIHFYEKELKEKSLLPLTEDHNLLSTIARLCGALFSDGNLYFKKSNNYREISFTLGQVEDVKAVENDLNQLGFKKLHLSERINNHNINGRKFTMHTLRVKSCSTSLFLLFKSLGVPVGNKRNQDYQIPDWIRNGSKEIKKEFLSGYLGGDGPKIDIRVQSRKNRAPYNNVLINDIEFHKKSKYTKSGLDFANQIKNLLEDQQVKINRIFYKKDKYATLDGNHSSIIHISISKKIESALAFWKIGYSYCKQKEEKSKYAGEFLKTIAKKRKDWKDLHKKTLNLYHKENKSLKDISKELNINHNTLLVWIKYRNLPRVNEHGLLYNIWLEEHKNGSK